MICFAGCQHEERRKHGKDRKGQQRWKCQTCGHTFVSDEARPLGDMRISLDDAAKVLAMLLEGMSIRACSRMTGIKTDTICDLILLAGENCDRYQRAMITGIRAEEIQMDEIWDFVGMKARTKERLGRVGEFGDSWTWIALDAKTKLVLGHAVGSRDEETCERFLRQVSAATVGPCQVTSDGLSLYRHRVPLAMGPRVSFAQLVKQYAQPASAETRYSPATIIGAEKTVRFGNPDEAKISTSYSERLNLSLRMHVRRFTRLTNAHSKTVKHHSAMTALFFCWYNFCRTNLTLGKKVTPAMAAGITTKPLTIAELLIVAA